MHEDSIAMINEDHVYQPVETIMAPSETLVCGRCKREYPSRGIHDTGYCVDCQNTIDLLSKMGDRKYSGLMEND